MNPIENARNTQTIGLGASVSSEPQTAFSCSIDDLKEHPPVPNKGDASLTQHPLKDPVNDAVSRLAIYAALSNIK